MFTNKFLIIWTFIFAIIIINDSSNGITSDVYKTNSPVLNLSETLIYNVTNISTESNRTYRYLYHNLKAYFLKWYLPMVIILGVVGTVFCLVFLFLSRLFPQNMLIWLVSICFGDFFILSLEGIWMLLKVWYNYDIRDINNFICIVHTSLSNYFFYWSAYMQTMLSLQRAYLIIRPLRARNSGPNMVWLFRLWSIISIGLVLPILPYPIYWRVINNDCDPTSRELFHVTTLNDFIIWGLIPLIGMTTSTVIICWNIFRLRKCFRIATSAVYLHEQESQQQQQQQRKSRENRFSTMIYPYKQSNLIGNCLRRSNSLSISESALYMTTKNQYEVPPRIYKPVSIHDIIRQTAKCSSTITNSRIQNRIINSLPSQKHFTTKGKTLSAEQLTIGIKSNSLSGYRHGAADNAGHVTRLLICMNIWYMASTYPLIIYLMLLNFLLCNVDQDVHKFIYYLSRSLCFLNACSNWIFYCASGRLFRSRIRQLIRRFLYRVQLYHSSQSSVPLPPDYTNQFKNNFVLNTSTNAQSRFTSALKCANTFRKNTEKLNFRCSNDNNNNVNNNNNTNPSTNNLLFANLGCLKRQNTDQLTTKLSDVSNDCTKIEGIENLSNIKHNNNDDHDGDSVNTLSNKYSNNCFPLGYRCFCNLFPCTVKSGNKTSDCSKVITEISHSNNEDKLQNKHNDGDNEIDVNKHFILGCNGCFTGFCCWRFWWYGLMAGCIKRIPNTVITRQESDQNQSVHMFTGLSTSSSVYDTCNMHRRHSEYALNNLTHKYSKHYRSTEKFRELEPKRKFELDLAIQRTFSTSISRKLHKSSKLYHFGRSVTTANTTGHSSWDSETMFEKDKSVDEKNSRSHSNSNSNNNNNNTDPLSIQPIIPKCFCYISSHGNRRFNYNLCKYHQDFSSSCRHHHNHNHRQQQYSLQHNSHLYFQPHCHHICKHNSLHKYRLPSSCHSVNRDIIVTSASTSMTKPTSTTISITNKDKNITINEDIPTQNQTLV
ncbi:unnamed protein product [Trichobilharzia szidati]|nr:unnamed protein product [Trichobilharzia szidati]